MSTAPDTVVATAMPAGPWLLVVGMHRSGTSAVTGALAQLGLAGPVEEDRWEPSEDNPDHWESRALGLLDDVLLERLGGTWDRPPDPDWESDADLALEGLDPAPAAVEAFPNDGPVVWKDPRVCLLLPYWLRHLPQPVAAVFIWRSPLAVARSLQARDGFHLADGVSLWERYNRAALAGLEGVDTYVTRYESLVADPSGGLGKLATWLADLPQFASFASEWDVEGAVRSISPKLSRQSASDDSKLLLPEQARLLEHLESLHGPHRPLDVSDPGAESPWTTAVLGDRHQLAALSTQRDALQEKLRAQKHTTQLLEAEVAARANEVELAQGALADARSMVEEAYEQRAEAYAQRAEAYAQRAEALESVEAQVAAAQAEVADAQEKLAGAHAQYQRLTSSTSWRITRPLRLVAARAGRIRSRRA